MALEPDSVLSGKVKDQVMRDMRNQLPWKDPNQPIYDRGNTSRPAVPGEPGAQQYRGQDVRVAQNGGFPPQPPPVNTGLQGEANRAAGLTPTNGLVNPKAQFKSQIDRTSFHNELQKNPSLVYKMAHMVNGEVGSKAPRQAKIVQLETAFNRAQTRGHSLNQALLSVSEDKRRGYYARDTYRQSNRPNQAQLNDFKKNVLDPVLKGSNMSDNGHGPMTGNASGKVAQHQFQRGTPGYKMAGGDTYFREGPFRNPFPALGDGQKETGLAAIEPQGKQQASVVPASQQQSKTTPTMGQFIQQNQNNPAVKPYSGMFGQIPDQHLPVDQWQQKHQDLINNPMVPQQVKDLFNQPTPKMQGSPAPQQVTPQSTALPFAAEPQPQSTGQFAPGMNQVPIPLSRPPGAGAQQQPMPAPSMQQQAVNNIRPPDQAPQQPQQQQSIMMPPTPGGQPNNAAPILGGPQMNMQQPQVPQPPPPPPPPPMPQMGAGLGAGTPMMGQGGAGMGMGSPVVGGGMDMGQPGLSAGTPMMGMGGAGGGMDMGGGGFGGGMGGGLSGGGMGKGGGGGGGGKGGGVNMQSAMSMIPKPIAMPQTKVDEGGIQPIRPQAPMPPGGDSNNTSFMQTIMKFLQPDQQA